MRGTPQASGANFLARAADSSYLVSQLDWFPTLAAAVGHMAKLFDLGFKRGQGGTAWKKTPPRVGSRS